MDISKLTEIELKALAYDQLALLEQTQANIRAINKQIAKLQNEASNAKAPVFNKAKEIAKAQKKEEKA